MKYLIGFIVGVVFTTITLVIIQRNDAIASNETPIENSTSKATTAPDDFEEFYTRFHTDSVFQLSRILFPLAGIPAAADSLTLSNGGFMWQQEDWTIHRPFDAMGGEFIQELQKVDETLVLDKIQHKSGQYGMQRRFAKFEDGWYLIYYIGMNKLLTES